MSKDLAQLSEVEREALLAYRDALLRYLPTQLRRLIVYGSRVRGDARADSDLDVVVVVTGHDERTPEGWRPAPFSDPVWQNIMDMACDISLEHAVYVSPRTRPAMAGACPGEAGSGAGATRPKPLRRCDLQSLLCDVL
jgi:hypothetical protein